MYTHIHSVPIANAPFGARSALRIPFTCRRAEAVLLLLADSWEVERLLDKREVKGKYKYLVDWKPSGAWPPSWEPPENISQDLIDEYEAKWEGSSPSL